MKSTNLKPVSDRKPLRLRAEFRDMSREEPVQAREKIGKQRISIMLNTDVVSFYKAKAGGRGYQTLINQTLHDAMRQEEMETVIRRVVREVIREELRRTDK